MWWLRHGDLTGAVRGLFFFFLGHEPRGCGTARLADGSCPGIPGACSNTSRSRIPTARSVTAATCRCSCRCSSSFCRAAGTGPRHATTRALRQGTLLVFWLCAAAVLLTYTMSGLGKLAGAVYQFVRLEPNAFAPGALGAHIAQRLLQTDSHSLLGAWIIEHPWLTWPAMPFAVYLELFSFVIAFRPALARVWAVALVVFHVGNYFTMTIAFPPSCFLLALFFFRSPFDPGRASWRTYVFGVPLAGDVIQFFRKATGRQPGEVKQKKSANADLQAR